MNTAPAEEVLQLVLWFFFLSVVRAGGRRSRWAPTEVLKLLWSLWSDLLKFPELTAYNKKQLCHHEMPQKVYLSQPTWFNNFVNYFSLLKYYWVSGTTGISVFAFPSCFRFGCEDQLHVLENLRGTLWRWPRTPAWGGHWTQWKRHRCTNPPHSSWPGWSMRCWRSSFWSWYLWRVAATRLTENTVCKFILRNWQQEVPTVRHERGASVSVFRTSFRVAGDSWSTNEAPQPGHWKSGACFCNEFNTKNNNNVLNT